MPCLVDEARARSFEWKSLESQAPMIMGELQATLVYTWTNTPSEPRQPRAFKSILSAIKSYSGLLWPYFEAVFLRPPYFKDNYRRGVSKGGNLAEALFTWYMTLNYSRPYIAPLINSHLLNFPPEAALNYLEPVRKVAPCPARPRQTSRPRPLADLQERCRKEARAPKPEP